VWPRAPCRHRLVVAEPWERGAAALPAGLVGDGVGPIRVGGSGSPFSFPVRARPVRPGSEAGLSRGSMTSGP
jgi:hypothetical protein